MKTENSRKAPINQISRFAIAGIVAASLSACGGGSDGNDIPIENRDAGVVNGYHLVSYTSYNEFDQLTVTNSLVYDFNLNRITTNRTDFDIDGNTTSSYREFYDEAGRLTTRETPEGDQLRVSAYTFDSAGLITNFRTDGSINTTVDFQYNSSGQLIGTIEASLNVQTDLGSMPSTRTFSYDENGNLVNAVLEQSFFDPVSSQTVRETRSTSFTTNDQGQIIRSETIDSAFDDMFTNTFRFDDNGNMVERTSGDSVFFERTVYVYEPSPEPIFNFWLRRFRFFP